MPMARLLNETRFARKSFATSIAPGVGIGSRHTKTDDVAVTYGRASMISGIIGQLSFDSNNGGTA
jgi:hypothetical protein